jgi:hypothetical protein
VPARVHPPGVLALVLPLHQFLQHKKQKPNHVRKRRLDLYIVRQVIK